MKAEPSRSVTTAVAIAMAGLVLLALITVAGIRFSNHHSPAIGTVDSSIDACQVVTTDEATAVFGDSAGQPHFVLGSCVYDDGVHELIVDVARQDGRTLFDNSRPSTAQDIPAIGDSAYYSDGRLRVLKGSALLIVTLSPYNPRIPNPKLLILARKAAARL